MRIKILLVLALLAALFVSSAVGTLAGYTSEASFGISVRPDSEKIRQNAGTPQAQERPGQAEDRQRQEITNGQEAG
jgi:hypothetical protein